MATNKNVKVEKSEVPDKQAGSFVFSRMNYRILIIGLAVIFVGFLLMSGGGSNDPNKWDPKIFSFMKVTVAPVIVLIGFILEGVAIMYRPKSGKPE